MMIVPRRVSPHDADAMTRRLNRPDGMTRFLGRPDAITRELNRQNVAVPGAFTGKARRTLLSAPLPPRSR